MPWNHRAIKWTLYSIQLWDNVLETTEYISNWLLQVSVIQLWESPVCELTKYLNIAKVPGMFYYFCKEWYSLELFRISRRSWDFNHFTSLFKLQTDFWFLNKKEIMNTSQAVTYMLFVYFLTRNPDTAPTRKRIDYRFGVQKVRRALSITSDFIIEHENELNYNELVAKLKWQ